MSDFTRLNGTAVRTTGTYHRVIEQPGGPPLAEVELVVISRGSMANRAPKQLLSQEPVHVDVPKGSQTEVFFASLENVQVTSSGTGESAVFRYDLTLRETPESAARRAAERAADPEPVAVAPTAPVRGPEYPEIDDDPSAPLDLSRVTVSGDSNVWATALKQLKEPRRGRVAAPPEPPLGPVERAGIEAILVNLRVDAMIDLLELKGVLSRHDVEGHFMKLVQSRFVAEATPEAGAERLGDISIAVAEDGAPAVAAGECQANAFALGHYRVEPLCVAVQI